MTLNLSVPLPMITMVLAAVLSASSERTAGWVAKAVRVRRSAAGSRNNATVFCFHGNGGLWEQRDREDWGYEGGKNVGGWPKPGQTIIHTSRSSVLLSFALRSAPSMFVFEPSNRS